MFGDIEEAAKIFDNIKVTLSNACWLFDCKYFNNY